MGVKISKQSPTALTASTVGPHPTVIANCRTPRHHPTIPYIRKQVVDMLTLLMTLRVCAKVLLHVWSDEFYYTTLSTE